MSGKRPASNSIWNYVTKKPCINIEKCNDQPINAQILNLSNVETGHTNVEVFMNDIGSFIGKDISFEKRTEVLKKVWIPGPNFNFPASGNRNLRFQYKWLFRWKWLAHSAEKNGSFCKFRALFGSKSGGIGRQPLGKLCTGPFDNWKDAIERFSKHEKYQYHQESIENAEGICSFISGKKMKELMCTAKRNVKY